ncbi:MAG TPA: XRE family transcriptional regulator [Gammaproteobacteria bacterium]|nr:XRE family transcriptional regulator [Gammaproteobacteria bacterium]
MSAQIIEKEGIPEFAVIPIDEYNALREKAEMLDDVGAYDRAIHELAVGEDETVPSDVAKRLIAGDEHSLKVWREYRGLTQDDLANAADLSQGQIAMLEASKRKGTIDVWKTLADVLGVDVDDLL